MALICTDGNTMYFMSFKVLWLLVVVFNHGVAENICTDVNNDCCTALISTYPALCSDEIMSRTVCRKACGTCDRAQKIQQAILIRTLDACTSADSCDPHAITLLPGGAVVYADSTYRLIREIGNPRQLRQRTVHFPYGRPIDVYSYEGSKVFVRYFESHSYSLLLADLDWGNYTVQFKYLSSGCGYGLAVLNSDLLAYACQDSVVYSTFNGTVIKRVKSFSNDMSISRGARVLESTQNPDLVVVVNPTDKYMLCLNSRGELLGMNTRVGYIGDGAVDGNGNVYVSLYDRYLIDQFSSNCSFVGNVVNRPKVIQTQHLSVQGNLMAIRKWTRRNKNKKVFIFRLRI